MLGSRLCGLTLALCFGVAGCATGNAPDTGVTVRLDAPFLDVRLDGTAPPDAPLMPDAGPGCDDLDMDGFGVGGGCTTAVDCDDTDDTVFPDATEVCNGVNDDCDGSTDEGFGMETCGVGACERSVTTCTGGVPQTCTPGMPGTETCNAIDDDCNGTVDDGFGMPITCGVGACQRSIPSCSGGMMMTCTPGSPTAETCNNVDDDCNGMIDDGLGTSTCGTGICRRMVGNCVGGVPQTCSPGPAGVEACNGQDDDCDGSTDEALGTLSCGFGRCVATAPVCVGGMPGTCVPNSGAARPEMCDGVDDDCNGTADDGIANLMCGVGACARSVTACITGVPQTCTPGSPTTEICGDAIDQDCNGVVEAVPGNSTCATATPYTIGSTVNADNLCSNADHASSCGLGSRGFDVAYTFNSTGSPTRYTIRMTGAATYDTVLHAHSSTACGTGDELACSDDFAGANVSEITLDSPPSGPIYLVPDTYAAGAGSTFTLTSSSSALNNDTCTSPIAIRANGTYTGSTVGRANNYTVPTTCSTFSSGGDVVYSITARTTGTITVTTCGSGFDTVLYVATTCGQSTTACNDDSCGVQSSVSFAATAGTTYYIVVDGYTTTGTYTMTVSGY
jgi:hypothetical protein